MTVYLELLRAELGNPPAEMPSPTQLVGRVLSARALVAEPDLDPATRLCRMLAYDVALARLCETLGVGHHFADRVPPEQARAEAESILAGRLPALAPDPEALVGRGD